MKKIIVLLLGLGLITPSSELKAINKGVVVGGTIASGLAGGLLGYIVAKHVEKEYPNSTDEEKKVLIKTFAIFVAGGISGYLGYLFLAQFTPKGRFKRAEKLIRRLERNKRNLLEARGFDLGVLQRSHPFSDIPLVKTMQDCEVIACSLDKATRLLQAVQNEDDSISIARLEGLIDQFVEKERACRDYIVDHQGDAYRAQLEIFEVRQERAKRAREREEDRRSKRALREREVSLKETVVDRIGPGTTVNVNI